MQPFSVIRLLTVFQQKYSGTAIEDGAIFPSQYAMLRYVSLDKWAFGQTYALFSPMLFLPEFNCCVLSHNMVSLLFFLSFSSTFLIRIGMLSALRFLWSILLRVYLNRRHTLLANLSCMMILPTISPPPIS